MLSADIVVANLPVDVLRKLRLDYDSLRAVKDNIILVMASTFGPDGPYRDRVGFDGVAQAMSGAMSLTGLPDDPRRSVVPWADYGTALHAAFGAMAALYHRAQTGAGQVIDVSLLATSIMFMTPLLMEAQLDRHSPPGTRQYGILYGPQRRVSHAQRLDSRAHDRRPHVSSLGTTGRPRGPDRRCACKDDITRGNNAGMLNDVMIAWCAARTREEAMAQLERARIPCGPVCELDEALNDPQVRARRLFVETPLPGNSQLGPVAAPAVRLSQSPGDVRRCAPLLGEHTDEVLRELEFTADEIKTFRSDGVI